MTGDLSFVLAQKVGKHHISMKKKKKLQIVSASLLHCVLFGLPCNALFPFSNDNLITGVFVECQTVLHTLSATSLDILSLAMVFLSL